MHEQLVRSEQLLGEHRSALDSLTEQLLTRETVDGSVVRHALDRSTAAA